MRISDQLFAIGLLILLITGLPAYGAASPGQVTAETRYPGLFSGALKLAIPGSLPKGELLLAEKIKITQAQLDAEIEKASPSLREQFRDNAFFVLEQMAVQQLLTTEARKWAVSKKLDTKGMKDKDIIREYFASLAEGVSVSIEDAKEFYEANPDMFGGAEFDQVQKQLQSYLLKNMEQEFLETHIDNLGKRKVINISDAWAKTQYAKALDNPVDKMRRSGKPSLIDFGATGCRPCDMMAPILEELKEEYAGVVNVEFINVRENQILGARYGISSIPVQVFFDKDGSEVYRHTGFFAKDQILAELSKMGAIR